MKKRCGVSPPILLLADLITLTSSFALAVFLRTNLTRVRFVIEIPIAVYVSIILFWIIGGLILGLYRTSRANKRAALIWLALNALANASFVFLISIRLIAVVPRSVFVAYPLAAVIIMLAIRISANSFSASRLGSRMGGAVLRTLNVLKALDRWLYQNRGDLIIAVLVSFAWVFLNYRAGFIYSPDSVEYISMASKLRYAGATAFLPYWPPLFPLLITMAMLLTPFPANAAMLVVCASTVGALFVFVLIARRIFASSFLALIAFLTFIGLGPLLDASVTVWSEMTFVFLGILSLYFALRFGETDEGSTIYLALIFAGLAALTRYIGSVYLMTTSSLIIWLSLWAGKRIRILPILLPNLIFFGLLALLRLRNDLLYGENWFDAWMGPRGNLVENLPQTLGVAWRIFSNDLQWPLVGLVMISLVWLLAQASTGTRQTSMIVAAIATFFVPAIYLAGLLYSSIIYRPVLLDSRLLFPAYVPLLIFALVCGLAFFQWAMNARNPFVRLYIPFLIVFLMGASLVSNFRSFPDRIVEILRHAGESDIHFDDGYSFSSTAHNLAGIFRLALERENDLDVFILVTPETYGRLLLLQEDIFPAIDIFISADFVRSARRLFSVIGHCVG